MERKINGLALSGLMIGPILGSGIILLPPLVFDKIGHTAIYGWSIILILGVLFAMIFARLSMAYPGEGGMTIAVEKVFGLNGRLLSSFALMSAVMFGPVAVLLTAAQYLNNLAPLAGLDKEIIALVLVVSAFLILLNNIGMVSKISLAISSVITLILIVSSINVLSGNSIHISGIEEINPMEFGRALLLLFWAIIGWEVVGSYSSEVKNGKATILFATVLSLIVVSLTYFSVALAVQSLSVENISLNEVLYPLFGNASGLILAFAVAGLCVTTYLTIVGAMGRLAHALALDHYLPKIFTLKTAKGIPVTGIGCFSGIHLMVLALSMLEIVDMERLVMIANGFFIANAILGLAASVQILRHWVYKVGALVLLIAFSIMLVFLEPVTLIGYGLVVFAVFAAKKRQRAFCDLQVTE